MLQPQEAVIHKLPPYEDSNDGSILYIQLDEPNKTYGEEDFMLSGNISFMFSPSLNEVFAKGSYTRCYVVLQLKCAFASQIDILRSYKRPYFCHRMIALEIEGPFPKSPMNYGCHKIPFEKDLEFELEHFPPTLSLATFNNTNGGTSWQVSSWIEGVDQEGEVEAMHWTEHKKVINVYMLQSQSRTALPSPEKLFMGSS